MRDNNATPTGSIVVFGATGYTGRLVIESLVRRDIRPVLAGRSADSLERMAIEFGGLEFQTADVSDPASVRALVDKGDVLVTTVGPFERYGWVAAEAAAEAGAHYLDSTGEVGFVRELVQRYGERATETDAVMVPAFGYDYVPGVLAGMLAIVRAGAPATRLDVGYFSAAARGVRRLPPPSMLSQGTRKTVADGMSLPMTIYRDGRLADVRMAQEVARFDVAGKRVAAILASGTEVFQLPAQYPQLREVRVFNGWFPALARLMQVQSKVIEYARKSSGGRRVVDAVSARMIGPAGGPDAAERNRTTTQVVAVARDASGGLLSDVRVQGPNTYTITGELLAVAAQRLSRGDGRATGVVGPIDAFGVDGLTAVCADAGLRPTD